MRFFPALLARLVRFLSAYWPINRLYAGVVNYDGRNWLRLSHAVSLPPGNYYIRVVASVDSETCSLWHHLDKQVGTMDVPFGPEDIPLKSDLSVQVVDGEANVYVEKRLRVRIYETTVIDGVG